MKVLKEVEGFGGEGLMLRAAHSMYEHCRSKKLLKVKTFFDEEAKVIGHEKGQGKNADKMGYLICETPDGRQFNVGGGFTDKQRLNPPKIGSVITYKYFELSAALKPRFPIFIGIRNDIDWDEYCKTYKPPTKKVPPALKKTHTIMFSDVLTTSGLEPSSVPSLTNDDDDDSDDIEEYKAAMSSEVGEKSSKSDDKSENEEIIKVDDVKVDKRLPCKYGANCYRQNPTHFKLFTHPPDVKCPYKAIKDDGDDGDDKKMEVMTEEELLSDKQVSPLAVYESQSDLFEGICDDDDDDDDYVYNSDVDDDDDIDDEPQTKKQKIDGDDKRPICKYGDKCYRKNPKHFKLFRHIKIDDTEQKKPEKHKVYLVNENDETFEMNEGSNDIGRGFAGITDQHLSRKQACINVDSVAGAATLSVTGGNASFVKKAGSSNWEKVAQGSTVKLNNNDAIMMVKDSPVFTLKIVAN